MTLTLAVPSKGRIRDDALAVLARAGIEVAPPADARSYRTEAANVPGLEIAFLSASEIAREVARGRMDLGVTGLDLMWEAAGLEAGQGAGGSAQARTRFGAATLAAPLGFGHADVVVALPAAWFDVGSMTDLADVAAGFRALHGHRLRVATKYRRLTRHHLARHGVRPFRIVESLGATEGAPHAGLADAIVDITSTGSTLRANALKVPAGGLILRSEACLFAADTPAEATSGDRAAQSPRSRASNGSLRHDIIGRVREGAAQRD